MILLIIFNWFYTRFVMPYISRIKAMPRPKPSGKTLQTVDPMYTIKDLSEGRCAVKNDGTLEELRKVLKKAFPKDLTYTKGISDFYYRYSAISSCGNDFTYLPFQSVKDFLKQINTNSIFHLPEKWCLKPVTKEQGNIIREWINEIKIGSKYKVGREQDFYWHYPEYDIMHSHCYDRPVVGYEEITFDQFEKCVLNIDRAKSIVHIPEKWACNPSNENEGKILMKFLKQNGYKGLSTHVSIHFYAHFPFFKGGSLYDKIKDDYTEITFNQFEKYVLNIDRAKSYGSKTHFKCFSLLDDEIINKDFMKKREMFLNSLK